MSSLGRSEPQVLVYIIYIYSNNVSSLVETSATLLVTGALLVVTIIILLYTYMSNYIQCMYSVSIFTSGVQLFRSFSISRWAVMEKNCPIRGVLVDQYPQKGQKGIDPQLRKDLRSLKEVQ